MKYKIFELEDIVATNTINVAVDGLYFRNADNIQLFWQNLDETYESYTPVLGEEKNITFKNASLEIRVFDEPGQPTRSYVSFSKFEVNGVDYHINTEIPILSLGDNENIEINFNAKLPRGFTANGDPLTNAAIWPALWLMGEKSLNNNTSGWPNAGELDVMEHFGLYKRGEYAVATHTSTGFGAASVGDSILTDADLFDTFNNYGVKLTRYPYSDKSKNKIQYMFNGVVVEEQNNTTGQFDDVFYSSYYDYQNTNRDTVSVKRFVLLMNIALGGIYTGYRSPGQEFSSAEMVINNVTVTKSDIFSESAISIGGSNVITQNMIDHLTALYTASLSA